MNLWGQRAHNSSQDTVAERHKKIRIRKDTKRYKKIQKDTKRYEKIRFCTTRFWKNYHNLKPNSWFFLQKHNFSTWSRGPDPPPKKNLGSGRIFFSRKFYPIPRPRCHSQRSHLRPDGIKEMPIVAFKVASNQVICLEEWSSPLNARSSGHEASCRHITLDLSASRASLAHSSWCLHVILQ